MNYDDVSRTFIRLDNGPNQSRRFWLDEDALRRGKVHAPDGTSEQCAGCGHDLAETGEVDGKAGRRWIKCTECREIYEVEEKEADDERL